MNRGMMGYRPPISKMPANPYAGQAPVDPFAQAPQSIAPMMQQIPAMNAAPVKQGFDWSRALGILSDGLAGAAGQPGMYAQNQMRQRAEQTAFERGEQNYQRTRRDGMQDWQAKQEWERENPKPVNNDTVADYNFIMQNQGKEAAELYLKSRYDPIVNIPLPGGDAYVGPRSGMGAMQQPTPQRPAVGQRHPGFQGGAAPKGTGGFR